MTAHLPDPNRPESSAPVATIHQFADVHSPSIGAGTRVWQFVVILGDAVVGRDCNICAHCFIENDVTIGDRVTVKSGVYLWDGVRLADDVFIGPNATFTNDRYPRSRDYKSAEMIVVGAGASIGAGATILPGIEIGAGAMIGAGAVVTRSVPPGELWVGNPARMVRRVEPAGTR